MRHCLYSNEDIAQSFLKNNRQDLYCLSASIVTIKKRSTKGVTRLSSWERKQILMPNDIKDVLIGILLGDTHIVKRSSTGNSRLVYAQTAITHAAYFQYVYSLFTIFCAKNYKPQSRVFRDKRTNKNIVLYLLPLCNFLVLMFLENCFIYQM